MAIYSMGIGILSRGKGRSVVCAVAYLLRDKVRDLFLGYEYDFTHKPGFVDSYTLLPNHAPAAYADNTILWNAVELSERAINAQLARHIVLALPRELTWEQKKNLTLEYVQKNFVDKGMCATVVFHDDDGNNPHAHILLTMRPIKENGEWGAKSKMEYVLDENGQRVLLPSGRPKTKKIKFTDWDERCNAETWRKAWADILNLNLEMCGHDVRVDHRSYERQGIDQIPTIHLGKGAHYLEKNGIATERGDINREIKKDNAEIREINNEVLELQRKKEALLVLKEEKLAELREVTAHSTVDNIEIENACDDIPEPQSPKPQTPSKPQPIFDTEDSPAPDAAPIIYEGTATEIENSSDEIPAPQAVEPKMPEPQAPKPANLKPPTPERHAPERHAPSMPQLARDLNESVKSENKPEYALWIKIFDWQSVTQAFTFVQQQGLADMKALEDYRQKTQDNIADSENKIRSMKHELESLETLKWYVESYRETRTVYKEYNTPGLLKSFTKKKFYASHKDEIETHIRAKQFLYGELQLKKLPNLKKLSGEIRGLAGKIRAKQMDLSEACEELKGLPAIVRTVKKLLAYRQYEKQATETDVGAVDPRTVEICKRPFEELYFESSRIDYFQSCVVNSNCADEIFKALSKDKSLSDESLTETAEEV